MSTATLAVGFASARDLQARGLPLDAEIADRLVLIWLLGCVLAVLVAWRHRWPELVIALSTAAAVLLPLDPTPALVGWVAVVATRHGTALYPWAVPAVVATVASTWRDGRGTSAATSLWQSLITTPGETVDPLGWLAVAVISTVVFAVATAIGVMIRLRGRTRELTQRDTVHARRLDELQEAVEHQTERERVAREVHDALGHRLSLLSLHAGALQTAASDDPQVQKTAALIQDHARQSVLDLQGLLGSLRAPAESPADAPGMAQVQRLVDDSLDAGAPVVGLVEWGQEPHPVLGHTAYRVVQELLTNARRHAPGIPVRLGVVARPEAGISISTVNALSGATPPGGLGHGLSGVRSRVEMVGGHVQMGVDPEYNAFRVEAWIPWDGSQQQEDP